jgi:hypothetical protein
MQGVSDQPRTLSGTPSRLNIGAEIDIAIGIGKMVGPATGAWLATIPVRWLVLLPSVPIPIPISIAIS